MHVVCSKMCSVYPGDGRGCLREEVLGGGNNLCKGPEVGACLVCLKNSKEASEV